MASPFKFFRKHQTGMMVVLVILSMLLFTLDSLFSQQEPNFWLLGLLLGGAVFGTAGISQGRWLQWGLGGAFLGAALGFILPDFLKPPGVISTSLGVIEQEELDDLQMRRFIANRFLAEATEASFGPGMAQFAQQFGYGHQTVGEDVIFGKLLREKAKEMGIAATKPMVNDFIHNATAEKLKAEDFARIRSSFKYRGRPLDDDSLFEILGEQLQAQLAHQMLRPSVASLPPAPEVFWQFYRRLNVRQQLNTAAVDVDAFLDQVGEPTDADVQQLFTEYKERLPNEVEPGSPGFRLRHRMQLAWLELDYDTVEAQVAEVTDAEIEKYYEDNKEIRFSTPVIPDKEPADDAPADAPADAIESDTATPATPEEPTTDEPATDEPSTDEPSTDEPATDEPATDEPATNEPATDEPSTDEPSTDEPSTDEPTTDEPTTDEPATDEPTTDEPATDEPATDEPSTDEPATDDSCNPFGQDEPASAATDAADTDVTTVADPPASDPATPTTDAATGDSPSLSLEIPDTPTPTNPTPDGAQQTGPDGGDMMIEYEYRELNDELKSEIRDELLRQRVQEAINSRMVDALTQMQNLSDKRRKFTFALIDESPRYNTDPGESNEASEELRAKVAEYAKELNSELRTWAGENGFQYVETPLVSDVELFDEENYPIGRATEPQADLLSRSQSPNVTFTLFSPFFNQTSDEIDPSSIETQLYIPRLAATSSFSMADSGSNYAYWATNFSVSHVPTLDEPGVREQVVLTWKRLKARELAQQRATELAKEVRTALNADADEKPSMAAVLEDETVTGSPDGTDLAVRTTQPFSWLQSPMTPQMNFQGPQVTMSTIRFAGDGTDVLESVGDEFMTTIFEEMEDGEVNVVPDFDRSRYYVVQVTNRFPTPEIGEDGLRQRFLNEGRQFAFGGSPVNRIMQQEILLPANVEWEKAIWREFGVDPDAEPGE